MKPSLSILCAYVIAAVCLTAPVSAEPPPSKEESIKIGVVFGLTGAARVWGEFGRMGLELARDEINESGGLKGRRVELIFEDSQSSPAQSVSAYLKLTTVDRVALVIGNVWSFLTNPLIPLSERDRMVLVSPTAMPESLERTSPYFFSMGERIESIREAVALFFGRNPEIKRIGIFCWEDMWGQGYLRIWREVAEKSGVKIDATLCTDDFTSDFRTDVAKMAAKRVDAVLIAHMGDVILQRMKELGFTPKVLATSNIVEDIKVKNAPVELFEGIYVTDWKPSREFIEKFRRKFRREPAVEAHNSYETLRAIGQAFRSEEPDLLSALKKIQYEGTAGTVDFTRGPFANYSTAKLFRVRNGEFELVN